MPIDPRKVDIDDSGDNLSGTPHTNAWLQDLQDRIDKALAMVFVTDGPTGNVNNYAFAKHAEVRCWQWGGTADLTLTGVAGGQSGDVLVIKNVSSGKVIRLPYLSASSLQINSFYNPVSSGPTPVAPHGWVTYVHNGSSWVLINHQQGEPITPVFNAANFLAAGGPWTVSAGQVAACQYTVVGKLLMFVLTITGSNIAATASSLGILNGAYGGFTITLASSTPAVPQLCYMTTWTNTLTQYGSDRILLYLPTGSFPAAGINVYLTLTIPIT